MPEPAKRKYPRFRLPSATVSFRTHDFHVRQSQNDCPVLDLSIGGLRFCADTQLKPGCRLHLTMTFPGKESPIELHARVIHCLTQPEKKDSYHIGVVFSPFASGKQCNSPETLLILDQLEQQYAASSLNNRAGILY